MPAKLGNHDLLSLSKRVDRAMIELHKSVSSSSSELNEFDYNRTKANLQAITDFQAWAVAQPQLDLPETSGSPDLELEDAPATPETENDTVNDLIRLLRLAREELLNSQSARKSAGLIVFDSDRLSAMVTKANNLLEYAHSQTPLDLPESAPRNVMSGPGRKGV